MPLVALPDLITAAKKGELVSFATDTLPALAVVPQQAERLFTVKQRALDKPLILMGANLEAFEPYWHGTAAEQEVWRGVMAQHWPGPLTLVLPIDHPDGLTMNPQNPNSLGFRIPQHPQALAILAQTGALATTSANRSGEAALTDLTAIATAFPTVYALKDALGGGSGVASTVAAWREGQWVILRAGSVELNSAFDP
jgi:L-threonylcarbamoyladenylate synthase